MTEQKFINVMEEIEGAYPRQIELTDKMLKVWYEYLRKFDGDIFEAITDEYIVTNPKPPTIADLYKAASTRQKYRDDGYEVVTDGVKIRESAQVE